jgi:hypothetical protein
MEEKSINYYENGEKKGNYSIFNNGEIIKDNLTHDE